MTVTYVGKLALKTRAIRFVMGLHPELQFSKSELLSMHPYIEDPEILAEFHNIADLEGLGNNEIVPRLPPSGTGEEERAGYAKPPKHSQFKKGNRGRVSRSEKVSKEADQEELITVSVGGEKLKLPIYQALFMQIEQETLEGDLVSRKDYGKLIRLMKQSKPVQKTDARVQQKPPVIMYASAAEIKQTLVHLRLARYVEPVVELRRYATIVLSGEVVRYMLEHSKQKLRRKDIDQISEVTDDPSVIDLFYNPLTVAATDPEDIVPRRRADKTPKPLKPPSTTPQEDGG